MQKSLFWRFGVYLAGLLILISCKQQTSTEQQGDVAYSDLNIEYARNFSIRAASAGIRVLTISNAESKHGGVYEYALVGEGACEDSIPENMPIVHLPVTNFICMTSLQLSNFIALDLTDHVKGITSTRHLFSKAMEKQLASGQTMQIGIEGNFDTEVIIGIDPELVLVSPSKRGGFDALAESGLQLMPHLGYQEPDPLGQAEWVKLIGVLTCHEQEAVELFNQVRDNYLALKTSVQECDTLTKPTVMSGDMKGGNWYATGGRSFLAQVIKDAGATYFMEDDESTGGVNIDFETVYAQGAQADYWRVSNSFNGDFSYEELGAQDSRFRDFKAFRQHQVIYCNMSKVPFYESFPVHPDWILEDFLSIFHPGLKPNHKPHYYHVL